MLLSVWCLSSMAVFSEMMVASWAILLGGAMIVALGRYYTMGKRNNAGRRRR